MSDSHSDVLITERRAIRRRQPVGSSRRQTLEEVVVNEQVLDDSPDLQPQDHSRQIADRRRQDRRRQIDPTTCERDYSIDEIEFMKAMDDYKRKSGRPFPTWSEVLEVLISLGYRKVAEPSTMAWRTFGDAGGLST